MDLSDARFLLSTVSPFIMAFLINYSRPSIQDRKYMVTLETANR